MIPIPSGVRVWLAAGHTDMRRGFDGLALKVQETLKRDPHSRHVREKFSCRACEAITQPPAPSHPIARGRAGPALLAQVLFFKYALHLPLNRQSAAYAREGIDLDVSTLADWVGPAAATLTPLVEAIRTHVFAAERIHADDTTVPVLAKGKTRTGRLWTYVRDDQPFGGRDPPAAAAFFYSRDRTGEHPERHLASYSGLMQADAYVFAEWRVRRVGIDYHVDVDDHFYSVPYARALEALLAAESEKQASLLAATPARRSL